MGVETEFASCTFVPRTLLYTDSFGRIARTLPHLPDEAELKTSRASPISTDSNRLQTVGFASSDIARILHEARLGKAGSSWLTGMTFHLRKEQ